MWIIITHSKHNIGSLYCGLVTWWRNINVIILLWYFQTSLGMHSRRNRHMFNG